MTGRERLVLFAAALWWGSLTAVGAWVVPLLFANLPAPALAGNAAARLFSAQTWVALGCGLAMLAALRPRGEGFSLDAGGRVLGWILAGMLLALLSEFAVAPRIVARDNLRLWHSVGSLLFAAQWVCAGAALWKAGSARR